MVKKELVSFYLGHETKTNTKETVDKYSHLATKIILDFYPMRNSGKYSLDGIIEFLSKKYDVPVDDMALYVLFHFYGVDLELCRKDKKYREEVYERCCKK